MGRTGGPRPVIPQGRRGRRRNARGARYRRRRAAFVGAALALVGLAIALLVEGVGGGSHAPAHVSGADLPHAHAHARVAGLRGLREQHTSAPSAAVIGYPETLEIRSLIALGKPIYCAARKGNEVALTFDDGPGPYTRLAIAKLRKHHIHATFFIVGRNIRLVPGATREERALGAVGDHTYTHPLLTALSASLDEQEIVSTQADVEASSGGPVFLFRPPYGAHDETVDAIVRSHGMLEILWTVDSQDSLGANYAEIERNVIAGLHGGAIILMHENHGQTIRAMLGIFAAIQRKRIKTVSVPQLLTDDPPTRAQLDAGGAGCGQAGGVNLAGGS